MDDRELALELAAWLEKHIREGNHGPDLVRISGYSENRLRQKFYNATGETPAGYLRKRRLSEAAKALLRGERIAQVASTYGYSSQDNFTTAFKSWFGMNPGELQVMDARHRAFLARLKEPLTIMELEKLKQPNLCATLMNCIKGASEYYDFDWSYAKLFGYGTMGFMVNIHKDLCPSGPYVWRYDQMYLQLRNMGIRFVETLEAKKDTPPRELKVMEDKVRAWLDAGKIVMLGFLEFQLVLGYDDQGFIFLRSWDCDVQTEITKMSFNNWTECLDREGWVNFTFFEKDTFHAEEPVLLRNAIAIALRMGSNPQDFTACEPYAVGDGAWKNWLDCLDRGLGTTHGHWWNGMVWAECRDMTSKFFAEVEGLVKGDAATALCRELSALYGECRDQLHVAKEKEASVETQKAAISRCRELDARAGLLMKQLLPLL